MTGCEKCGRFGHKSEDCFKPVICPRCKQEGHLARVCTEVMPWEFVAPYYGIAAQGQGFHLIQGSSGEDKLKDMDSCAMITITSGSVSAKQLENEFKSHAGPQSTWRWFAKRVSENVFQMRFPTAKKV